MELLLNVLWLLIALTAVGAWCIDRACQNRRAPSKLLPEGIALACALVFVFFAVSLSDDLQATAGATLSDDCAAGRRHSLVWDSCHSSHQNAERPQMSSAAAPSQLLFSPNLRVAERILSAAAHVYRDLKGTSLFGRSPPRPSHS